MCVVGMLELHFTENILWKYVTMNFNVCILKEIERKQNLQQQNV